MMGRLGPGLGAVLLLGGCFGATIESSAPTDVIRPGTWATLAPMPTARQEVAVAAIAGRIWVIGGFGPGAEPSAQVEVYDPAGNQWEERAPLPVPTHHPAAAAVGDRVFVIGGYTGGRVRWTASQAVWEYDRARNAWAPRTAMPSARGALAVAVLGDRIHAVGGSADHLSQAHEVYDPTADRWTAANPLPTARDHLAAVAFQGRLWVLGGRTSFMGTQLPTVEIWDPAADAWRVGPALPEGRGGIAAAALTDRVLVFGGEAPLRIFNSTEMYDVTGNRWIAKAPMPTARHGIGAAVLDGRVYIPGGGRRPGFAATDVNEAYVP